MMNYLLALKFWNYKQHWKTN